LSTWSTAPRTANPGSPTPIYASNCTPTSQLRDKVDSPVLTIGGVEDHVHVLLLLSRKFAVMNVVEEAKTETTKWVKKQAPQYEDFHWQSGYGAFSVSESKLPQVKQYIANQVDHHAKQSYQDEFRALCRRHGIEIDERYVWD